MTLYVPFADVKNAALLALYRMTYASTQQEYFDAVQIGHETQMPVGVVFLGRVLDALVDEEVAERSSGDDSFTNVYRLTNNGWLNAERLIRTLSSSEEPVEGVPASDRVVSLTDNQRDLFQDSLVELEEEMQRSNEVGDLLGNHRDRVNAELEASRRLLSASQVRLGALVATLAVPLRWLAEKFGGAAVGELAKRLLAELWKLLGS